MHVMFDINGDQETSQFGCADRDIAAGEQVLHTYGDLSDAELLQIYGFVEDLAEPNPHNRVLIPHSLVLEVLH